MVTCSLPSYLFSATHRLLKSQLLRFPARRPNRTIAQKNQPSKNSCSSTPGRHGNGTDGALVILSRAITLRPIWSPLLACSLPTDFRRCQHTQVIQVAPQPGRLLRDRTCATQSVMSSGVSIDRLISNPVVVSQSSPSCRPTRKRI